MALELRNRNEFSWGAFALCCSSCSSRLAKLHSNLTCPKTAFIGDWPSTDKQVGNIWFRSHLQVASKKWDKLGFTRSSWMDCEITMRSRVCRVGSSSCPFCRPILQGHSPWEKGEEARVFLRSARGPRGSPVDSVKQAWPPIKITSSGYAFQTEKVQIGIGWMPMKPGVASLSWLPHEPVSPITGIPSILLDRLFGISTVRR